MAGMDENKPYLPERYRQKIREKNRRRVAIRILTISIILFVIAVLAFSLSQLSWAGLPTAPFSPYSPPAPSPVVVTTVSIHSQTETPSQGSTKASLPPVTPATALHDGGYSIEPGVPQQAFGGSLSLLQAETALRRCCPEDLFTIRSVNYSAGTTRSLFGFTLQTTGGWYPQEDLVVFIDAASGIPWAAGEGTAAVPKERVSDIVVAEFPGEAGSPQGIWYLDNPSRGGAWRFTHSSGNTTLVYGSVDATTGEIRSFARNIPAYGRPADPAISEEIAQKTAERYVSDRNSGLSLALTSSRYDQWGTESVPAAGAYTFSLERRHLDYPVDTDGISVVVDALTEEVIGYEKRWTTPEYAFSQAVVPSIARHDATYAVMEAAKVVYPEQIGSVRILSSEMRWNNGQMKATVPRPGSVPLAWKIVFDDELLRADASLAPGIAWVDIQTGNVTAIEYRH
ncbi:YcdB/YcdC domain-containing protein [Methanoregula sp.]|uniref:YcdB/YcdC domain-containing protein n=1 Tax=Methanoregula sp. TaxID=2052170 RepID=UPI000CA96EF3|nr:YcdB/YcdC domain-containing protein [Methanoregula sp.]PKG33677.1 MAG: hypothetical protein CW742_01750 [Methanoregula sp.]